MELPSEQVLDLCGGSSNLSLKHIRNQGGKMVLGQNRRAVRIFNNRIDGTCAQELNRFGFSVDQISMVALDVDLDDQLSMSDHVGNKLLSSIAPRILQRLQVAC